MYVRIWLLYRSLTRETLYVGAHLSGSDHGRVGILAVLNGAALGPKNAYLLDPRNIKPILTMLLCIGCGIVV